MEGYDVEGTPPVPVWTSPPLSLTGEAVGPEAEVRVPRAFRAAETIRRGVRRLSLALSPELPLSRSRRAAPTAPADTLARFDERVASLMRYVDKVFTLDQSQIKPPSGNQAAEYTAGVRLAREKCATPYCLWID